MAEHVYRGEIAIYPRAEGGKQFIVNDLGEIYRVPLPEEAVEKLIRDLSMDNDELMNELERRKAAEQLAVADPNGHRIIRPGDLN